MDLVEKSPGKFLIKNYIEKKIDSVPRGIETNIKSTILNEESLILNFKI